MDLNGAIWRKSSRSGNNGGQCVEVAAVWRKSTRSGNNGGCCVEVANLDHVVAVRDSKDPDGSKLALTRTNWRTFVASIRDGAFDLWPEPWAVNISHSSAVNTMPMDDQGS